MTTETVQQFRGQQPDRSNVGGQPVGPKEGSGFTHGHNEEPISYHPDYAYKTDVPVRKQAYSILIATIFSFFIFIF